MQIFSKILKPLLLLFRGVVHFFMFNNPCLKHILRFISVVPTRRIKSCKFKNQDYVDTIKTCD
ncbi:hypothetical protein Hanom_Chr03g00230731 [Helianthus anomalus]